MAKEINVLFLDDEENILFAADRLLMAEAYGIKTTTDPDQAMVLIGEHPIKVVVSDQRMPKIAGIEFLRKVKAAYPDKVRILLSGYVDFVTAEEAINLGEVFRFITKPWKTPFLKASLTHAIEQYDMVQANRLLFEASERKNKELEALNNKLRLMFEAQKGFTSTVSHELRTPLASIKMAVDMVLAGTTGEINANQKKFLSKAKDNVDRLNRLINDILDLSKLETGRMPLKLMTGDLHEVIREVIEMQAAIAVEKGIFLNLEPAADLPMAAFDKDRLIQVLSNLIANALKFTDKGGVTVATAFMPEHNEVRVAVRDTGLGIQQADFPKLFQKFQQLGDAGERRAGGTGLGLAICLEIVTRHGGRIWVESTYGEGSCFYFTLPIQGKMEGCS
ncbi:MAG: hybrid sensor histidine kinase/response regulator [Candidatus Omnitrophica bacterium]|nr:hybrid sensor histidine kinase/response regulator [Candidatus Omnitrophota bacterium]